MIKFDAKTIAKLRKSKGLSQEEFGKLLGVHKITVSRWERGDKRPSNLALRRLERLAKK